MGSSGVIVLDTHAWIWFINAPDQLGVNATTAIAEARQEREALHISCISTWEVHMLESKGRLALGIPSDVWVARCESVGFLRFHPLCNDVARLSASNCSAMHADPADRMIVATAMYLGASVVTRDAKIRDSGLVPCIW